MQAIPLSRAVALHGLGKITIHEGEFKKGLALMEQSIGRVPTGACVSQSCRVLEFRRRSGKRVTSTPNKPSHSILKILITWFFAAVFMAAAGQRDEAIKIARANINLLPPRTTWRGFTRKMDSATKRSPCSGGTSSNTSATCGALKEMMEARVDAVFDSLREDPKFLALTSGADGRLQMPMKTWAERERIGRASTTGCQPVCWF